MAVQSVELLLDETTDAALRAQWAQLAAAGLPSQARHTGPTNAPHVTLAVRDRIPPELDVPLMTATALPVSIRLGGLLVFARRRCILARVVVPSVPLLDLHAQVHDVLTGCGPSAAHLDPGWWTPHVTLARNLTEDQLATAVHLLADATDVAGRGVAIRRWDAAVRRAWVL